MQYNFSVAQSRQSQINILSKQNIQTPLCPLWRYTPHTCHHYSLRVAPQWDPIIFPYQSNQLSLLSPSPITLKPSNSFPSLSHLTVLQVDTRYDKHLLFVLLSFFLPQLLFVLLSKPLNIPLPLPTSITSSLTPLLCFFLYFSLLTHLPFLSLFYLVFTPYCSIPLSFIVYSLSPSTSLFTSFDLSSTSPPTPLIPKPLHHLSFHLPPCPPFSITLPPLPVINQ